MANGFKLTGGSYVSKQGNNANSGLTDALPKLTITAGLSVGSGACVVLSGVYRGETSASTKQLIGDGVVKIINNNTGSFNIGTNSTNIYIEGYSTVTQYDGTNLSTLKNITNATSTNGVSLANNKYINSSMTVGTQTLSRCILINGIGTGNSVLNSCYVDSSFEFNQTSFSITFSNFRGKYTKTGVSYCVPTGADITISGGTATVVPFASRTETSYPSGCSDWLHVGLGQTATTCYVTNGNFNADPQFVDMFNEDFSVLPTSPMIGRGSSGSNIGNVTVTATSLRKTATQFTSKTNLSGTTDLTVESPNTTGTWISEVITIDALNPRVFKRPTYVGALNFEALTTGGVANINDNVPWIASYTKNGSTVTNTSPRPCILVRFSNKNTTPSPTVDSDWDNGNNNTTTVNGVLPGEYFLAELNADFKYDANGFGCADVNFNSVVNSYLAAKYVMYKVVLVDNYYAAP